MKKEITAEEFEKRFNLKPSHDDLHRVNCEFVGEMGHYTCGLCDGHKKPRFLCGCWHMTDERRREKNGIEAIKTVYQECFGSVFTEAQAFGVWKKLSEAQRRCVMVAFAAILVES